MSLRSPRTCHGELRPLSNSGTDVHYRIRQHVSRLHDRTDCRLHTSSRLGKDNRQPNRGVEGEDLALACGNPSFGARELVSLPCKTSHDTESAVNPSPEGKQPPNMRLKLTARGGRDVQRKKGSLVCGRRRQQLKREPLGSGTLTSISPIRSRVEALQDTDLSEFHSLPELAHRVAGNPWEWLT